MNLLRYIDLSIEQAKILNEFGFALECNGDKKIINLEVN